MAGVAEALQAIHAEGIVHRDLKPSNVLLAADGPRVIDFGIALAADGTSYTATNGTIGTPPFMAPEQASGDEITAATDVFALGQTAAYAALGKPIYGDGQAVNVLYRIVHSAPDLSLLPEPLRPLFARCLAADPAERAAAGGGRRVVQEPAGGGRGRWAHRVAGDHRAGGGGSGSGTRTDPCLPAVARTGVRGTDVRADLPAAACSGGLGRLPSRSRRRNSARPAGGVRR